MDRFVKRGLISIDSRRLRGNVINVLKILKSLDRAERKK